MTIVKRSIAIADHQTSFSLEDEFWVALKRCADAEGVAVAALVRRIDEARDTNTNLSSAIRLWVLREAMSGRLAEI